MGQDKVPAWNVNCPFLSTDAAQPTEYPYSRFFVCILWNSAQVVQNMKIIFTPNPSQCLIFYSSSLYSIFCLLLLCHSWPLLDTQHRSIKDIDIFYLVPPCFLTFWFYLSMYFHRQIKEAQISILYWVCCYQYPSLAGWAWCDFCSHGGEWRGKGRWNKQTNKLSPITNGQLDIYWNILT